MKRLTLLVFLVAGCLTLLSVGRAGLARSGPIRTVGAAGHRAPRWGAPVSLVPAGTATGSIGLAATADGSAFAGWIQGPPPVVVAGGPSMRSGQSTARQAPVSTGQSVVVAAGRISGAFGPSATLASGPSGSLQDLHVTLSAPGVDYAVWQGPATSLHLGVVRNGRAVVVRRLERDAVPVAIFPVSHGRAALVFDKYGHGTPLLEYGFVSPTGRLTRVAVIAHPGPHDTAAVALSVNPQGELAAAWVHDDGASSPGTPPTSSRFVPARLIVTFCRPAMRCAAPRADAVGAGRPACIDPAVSIGPDGAVAVIAAADDWGNHGCARPLGIFASVIPASARRLPAMRQVETQGDWPLAEPSGDGGTAIAFNSGPAISDAFSSAFLSTGARYRAQTRLDRNGFLNTGQQLLAPANDGWYLITWAHSSRRFNPIGTLDAAVEHDGVVHSAEPVFPATRPISAFVGATDGRGDALILSTGSTDRGDGAPYPYTSGLYTTARPR